MYKRIKKIFLGYIPTVIKTGLLYRMPYFYSFLEIKPTSCTIMITDRCNLKCIMCKQWREPVKKELSADDWKKIIIDLKKNHIRNIHFTGGEPLIRKDLRELISYSVKNGFVVGLTTNGFLLTKELLDDFIDAGLRSIAVSVDATDGAYENIRGVPHSFEKVKRAIFIVSETRGRKKIDAYINFTLMKDNIKELKNVKELVDRFQLPLAICILDRASSIFDLEENKDRFWIKEDKDFESLQDILNFLKKEKMKKSRSLLINFPAIDFIKDYFKDPVQRDIPCVSSQDRIIIDPYGNLLGGCLSMGNFGNIKNTPFSELQKKERYKIAKQNMFYKNCIGCSCGYLFNIRCFPKAIVKNLVDRTKYSISKKQK